MKSEPCMEWLEELEEAAGSEPGPALRQHLEVCSGCRAELTLLRRLSRPLAALALDDPGLDFGRKVVARLSPSSERSWWAPVAILLAGGAGGSVGLLGICVIGLWLWLGTERILASIGFAAADVSGLLARLLDPPSLPGLGSVGIALLVACGVAAGLAGLAKAAGPQRTLTAR